MAKMKRYLFIFILFFAGLAAQAQEVQMADKMRANGKIYVVVAVCLTILVGLFIYVFLVDRRLSRLEKNRD